MLAKSGKLLGVNLSGSSSSSKSSGLVGLKVSHGVESFASAASAMASVISRNASASKHKHGSGSSTSSPTNTGDSSSTSSKGSSSSAPSSSCGSVVPGSATAAAPALNHSVSCRLDDRQHSKANTSSGSILAAGNSIGGSAAEGAAGSSAQSQTPAASAATDASTSSTGSTPGSAKPAAASSRLGTSGQSQQAAEGGRIERPVPPDVFGVLSKMLNSILEVASAQDDSRVVLTVLELAASISCTTGKRAGIKQRTLLAYSEGFMSPYG